jgi:hypothetical protein
MAELGVGGGVLHQHHVSSKKKMKGSDLTKFYLNQK